eukprot:COSAG02_NODE_3749_length_6287_cov_6.407240_2_plen_100_part_00
MHAAFTVLEFSRFSRFSFEAEIAFQGSFNQLRSSKIEKPLKSAVLATQSPSTGADSTQVALLASQSHTHPLYSTQGSGEAALAHTAHTTTGGTVRLYYY